MSTAPPGRPPDTSAEPAVEGAAVRPEVTPFRSGELVAQRYRIESLLREDDLGWIYQVSEVAPPTASGPPTPTPGGRVPLALRLLRPRFGADGVALEAEAQKHWRGQLERLRDLRHPGIVPLHELCLGDEQGRVYAVRPAVELEGQPLSAVLATRPGGLPEAEAVRLYAAISEVVEAAHQQGVNHLGLSPGRIFLIASGESVEVKIADFALLPPSLGAQYGEPGYLSPEQVEQQPCDRRTDQFSLAVIFYEMLSGQPAFIGAPDEGRDVICARVVSEDPLPLALSRPIELALARALSRSRAVRFPGLRDFVCALGVDGVAWSLVRPPGPARSQYSSPSTRRPLYVPVLIGALSAVVAIASVTWWGRRLPPRRLLPDAAVPTPGPAAVPPQSAPPSAPTAAIPPPSAPPTPSAATLPVAVAPTGTPPPKPTGPSPAPPPLRPATVQLRPPIVQKSPTAGEKPAPGAGGEAEIRITTEGPPLSSREVERIKYCLRLISPRPPYSARLVPIGGTLYLADEQATSQVIWRSRDFRDCLKNEIQGNIGAKTVIIQGIVKGKAAP